MKDEIKSIKKALQETKKEQRRISELLQLLYDFLAEEHIIVMSFE